MRGAAIRGAVWGLLGQGVQLVLYFAGYVLLAQHLDKHQLGLAAAVLAVTGLFGVLADFGMGVLTVQRRNASDRWTSEIAIWTGLSTLLLVALAAPAVAKAFGDPEGFVPLLRAGAVALLLAGFASTARARLQRVLAFRTLVGVDVAVELARAVGRVAFAMHGYGAWAIVIGDILALGLGAILVWLLAPAMRSGDHRGLFLDGARIVGARAADACFVQADRLVVGARFGTGALGLYGFAFQHTLAAVQRLTAVAEQVALPILSRLQEDGQGLRRAYLALTRWFALLVVPFAALLWGFAPAIVDLLYPERWRDAVPALRALCFAVAAAGLNSHPGLVWIARGRMRLRLFWSVANLAALAAAILVGVSWGVAGVAYALAVRSLLATVVAQAITRRVAGVRHGDYLRALGPGLLAGAALLAIGLAR